METEATPSPLRIYHDLETDQYRDAHGNTFRLVNGAPPMGEEDFWDDIPPDDRLAFAFAWDGEDPAELLLRAGQWLNLHSADLVVQTRYRKIKPYTNTAIFCFQAAAQLNPELLRSSSAQEPSSSKPKKTRRLVGSSPFKRIYQSGLYEYFDEDGVPVDVVNGVPPTGDEAPSDEAPSNDEDLDRTPVFRFTWEGEDHIEILLVAAEYLKSYYPHKVLDCYAAVMQLAPKLTTPYNRAGHFLMEQEKFQEAIPYFQKCIELDPRSGRPYQDMSLIYYRLGDKENALLLLNQAIRREPQNLAACLLNLRWLMELKRWHEINDFYEQHQPLVQEAAEARLCYGLALAQEGRIEEGRAAFEAASLKSKRRFREITTEIAALLGLPHRKW